MTPANERHFAIELHFVLPSAVGLVGATLFRVEELDGSLRLILFFILVGSTFAAFRNLPLAIVPVATVFDKIVFNHPLVSYLAAAATGIYLLVVSDKSSRSSLLNGICLLLVIGLPLQLNPEAAFVSCAFLCAVAALSALKMMRSYRHLRFIANPLPHLLVADPNNQLRFAIASLAFLSFGSLIWSYAEAAFHGFGIVVHLVLTLLVTPLLLDWVQIEAVAHTDLLVASSQREQLVLQLAAGAEELSSLEKASKTMRFQQERDLATFNDRLRAREDQLERELCERAIAEGARLDQERTAANLQIESNFYAQSWDSLIGCLSDRESVAVPGGPTLATKDHFLIGTREADPGQPYTVEPVFIHRKILQEHIHILGRTGSGKTSQGITPIALQLLRNDPGSPLIFLDLKGERSLFHTIREETERQNRDFLFFTLESNKPTYRFNPFVGIRGYGGTRNEKVQPLLDALGLNNGEGYGRAFFTRMNRQRLFEAFAPGVGFNDLRGLLAALNGLGDSKAGRQRSAINSQRDELIAAIEGVAEYPQLFTTPEEEKNGSGIIQFDTMYAKNQVIYFWLPAPTQSISVREVGKLVLYNLFFAALKRKDAGEAKQAYLFIDEFQRIIGENLALFLEQCRSSRIGLTLANQNIDQLNTPDAKLWPLVQSNIRASLHFGSGDPKEIELLSQMSGETSGWLSSRSVSRSSSTSRALSTSKSRGETLGHSNGEIETFGSTDGATSGFGNHTESWSVQHGHSASTTDSYSASDTQSSGQSESEAHSDSYEATSTEYIRPRLRPHDITSIFNKQNYFFYWVRHGVPPLVDFDGKPVAVRGLYTMPLHLSQRREAAAWPKAPMVPGHTIQTPKEYRTSRTVTERIMVDEILSGLKVS